MDGKEIFDNYVLSEHKKIITADHHGIAGMYNISHYTPPQDAPIPLHYHSDIIEFHCIVKGQRTIKFEKDGVMNVLTARSNELMITYPFELHETGSRNDNHSEFYALQIHLRSGRSFFNLNDESRTVLLKELHDLKHRHLKLGNTQISMLRVAFNLLACGSEADKYSAISYLTCFLFNLKYLEPVHQTQNCPVSNAIQKTIQYVSENLENRITVQDLADASGYSLSYFMCRFKEYFGITPADYIMLRKISAAEKELLSSDVSITELAHRFSFSSSNYFCTVFKKIIGHSPSCYRRMIRES